MSKMILITIIIIMLVIVILGIYFISNLNKDGSNLGKQGSVSNNFEIQGMKVEILKQGEGVGAKVGDDVTAHYIGTLEDGREFDSSVRRNVPFPFRLGGNVITGWNLGVTGMKVGEIRKLTIPYELAYGADGFPPTIPQKATLIFVISLLGINPAPAAN